MFDIKHIKEKMNEARTFITKNIKVILEKDYIRKRKKEWIAGFLVAVIAGSGAIAYARYWQGKIEDKQYKITTNKAEEYFYADEYDKAIEEYTKLGEKDKNSLWSNMKIAEIYSVKGDLENSKKYIDKVKMANSKDVNLLNYLVFTEFMNKDYAGALKDGQEALKIGSKDKSLMKTMFTIYMANNQPDKARSLIDSYPADSRSAYETAEYARMLMIVGAWQEGFKELRSAWDINKDEIKIYDVLAQIAVYNKDMLLENISNLSAKNPTDAAYKLWLAKIYSSSDETADQAAKIMDSISNGDIGKIEPKLIRISILQNTKKPDKADELMAQIIKDNGEDYRVLHAAGWYYLNKKDPDKALEYCNKSITKNKDYPDNYGFLMPEILKQKGKSIEGEPFFRTAMEKEPYNYNIMLNIANFYGDTTKNSDKALEYYKFAEIVKPTDAEIKYNMALIYLNNNHQDEAIALLKQCIKLSEAVPKYHRTLGTIYMTKGNAKDGYKEIQYAYDADKEDIMTLNNAGAYYILVEQTLERGLLNFQKAYQGINPKTDKYTKDTITDNYNKAKKLLDDYKNGKDNQTLTIPDFVLFY